jgi:hypothetical protein
MFSCPLGAGQLGVFDSGDRSARVPCPGQVPWRSSAGPMSMREERDAQGFIAVNAYDGAQLRVDVSDIGKMRLHDGVTASPGACHEHFSSVDIPRRIGENPLLVALHAQSIANGGPGVTGHWVTVKANEAVQCPVATCQRQPGGARRVQQAGVGT